MLQLQGIILFTFMLVGYKKKNFFRLKPIEDKNNFFFSKHCKHQTTKLKTMEIKIVLLKHNKEIIQGKQSTAKNIKFIEVSSIGQK